MGTSVHPDLYRLQCEQGANHTYRKAEKILTEVCGRKREINNHNRIKDITNQVGSVLCDKNKEYDVSDDTKALDASELIVQVDGGHVKTTENDKRSFEIMSAKLYRPESVVEITEIRNEIKDKKCIASAKSDNQSTMKKYIISAAKHQGLTENTHVTALADGAKNCWSIIKCLDKHCLKLNCILDWFHIAKKIEPIKKSAPNKISSALSEVKAHLWKGNAKEALDILEELKGLSASPFKSKINGLYLYINRNKEYLIDYNSRAKNQQPYTSQVAESTVEHLINDRHKRNQKMQWSRDGAHNVLQVRASMASNQWVSNGRTQYLSL